MLRKLELIGCVRRVQAETQFNKPGNYSKCVKFIRKPEGKEWNQIARGAAQGHHGGSLDMGKDADSDAEDGGEVVNFVEEGGRLEAADQSELMNLRSATVEPVETVEGRDATRGITPRHTGAPTEGVRGVGKPLPQWVPDISPGNLLFRLIEASGIEGISTMVSRLNSFLFYAGGS
jgi:hypothetical protein